MNNSASIDDGNGIKESSTQFEGGAWIKEQYFMHDIQDLDYKVQLGIC